MIIKKSALRQLLRLLLLAVIGQASIASAVSLYVSDDLTVPMRSGSSLQHRILDFLHSGTAVEVLGASDDGQYQHIKADDKDGWVRTDQLMTSPSARAQLTTLDKRTEDLKDEIKQGKSTITELNARIKQLEDDNHTLETSRDGLTTSLEDLKRIAAQPAAIAQQNKTLEKKLANLNASYTAMRAENERLSQRGKREWFLIGGAVSLVSLLFGLIIPNIKWRKRNNWGNDF